MVVRDPASHAQASAVGSFRGFEDLAPSDIDQGATGALVRMVFERRECIRLAIVPRSMNVLARTETLVGLSLGPSLFSHDPTVRDRVDVLRLPLRTLPTNQCRSCMLPVARGAEPNFPRDRRSCPLYPEGDVLSSTECHEADSVLCCVTAPFS